MLRYQENNELHKDFHGLTATTLDYIAANYGTEELKKILRTTGKEVYKSIHQKLAQGDASELIEHLTWFTYREGGKFKLTADKDEIIFELLECPAIRHLQTLGIPVSPLCCLQTGEINAGMCENTPWETELEIVSTGHCIQKFYRKKEAK